MSCLRSFGGRTGPLFFARGNACWRFKLVCCPRRRPRPQPNNQQPPCKTRASGAEISSGDFNMASGANGRQRPSAEESALTPPWREAPSTGLDIERWIETGTRRPAPGLQIACGGEGPSTGLCLRQFPGKTSSRGCSACPEGESPRFTDGAANLGAIPLKGCPRLACIFEHHAAGRSEMAD